MNDVIYLGIRVNKLKLVGVGRYMHACDTYSCMYAYIFLHRYKCVDAYNCFVSMGST